MFDHPMDLSRSRLLVTNDDGIAAEGLRVLERIARSVSDDVWVVAPEQEQSGASHSLTLHRPLRVRALDARRYAVDGTPTDCVLLAVNRIMADHRPDLVLSGVNNGSNLGEDVTYSGTVAAGMEATLLGVPAIALSQAMEDSAAPSWAAAEAFAADVIRKAVSTPWPRDVLVNVNFPACPPNQVTNIQVVHQGNRKVGDNLTERVDPRGRTYYWIGASRSRELGRPDTDVAVIAQNGIAVTPLDLDLTDKTTLATLKQVFL